MRWASSCRVGRWAAGTAKRASAPAGEREVILEARAERHGVRVVGGPSSAPVCTVPPGVGHAAFTPPLARPSLRYAFLPDPPKCCGSVVAHEAGRWGEGVHVPTPPDRLGAPQLPVTAPGPRRGSPQTRPVHPQASRGGHPTRRRATPRTLLPPPVHPLIAASRRMLGKGKERMPAFCDTSGYECSAHVVGTAVGRVRSCEAVGMSPYDRNVSEGDSPNCRRYATEKRPGCRKPQREAMAVTVVAPGSAARSSVRIRSRRTSRR